MAIAVLTLLFSAITCSTTVPASVICGVTSRRKGTETNVVVKTSAIFEVEGIRLIADLVAAGEYASILPETALPPDLGDLRAVAIAEMPPRRLAIVNARDVQLSLADRAVREAVASIVAAHEGARSPRPKAVRSRGNGAKTRTRNDEARPSARAEALARQARCLPYVGALHASLGFRALGFP